jgi:membrane-associated phospholipid phosphatase
MRAPEIIQVVVVSLLVIAAQARHLERSRRTRVAVLAFVAIVAILTAKLIQRWSSFFVMSIVRDWLPGALMLIPYWQVGQFFTGPDPVAEARLNALDKAFFLRVGVKPTATRISKGISLYLELAYFLVYPLVPLGVAVLYTAGLRAAVDLYWVAVLCATYLSYAFTMFIRARPPRMLPGYDGFRTARTRVRAVNREILDHASIQAITCPSAHVASAFAAALVIFRLEKGIGAVFLVAAVSIAVSTIVGGYHYVADVLSGAILAILVFAIVCFI